MAEKVVSVRLEARYQGFVSGMQKAKASVDDLTKAAAPSKADAFGKMADKAALAGLGVATAVGVAVKRFADFDQAMSAVRANSGATGASLEALRQAAITMGADSQFSATEAAQGINEMAKAGVAAKDILGGGLKGALDLAAAGQISVADAAETAATAMTVFKLNGSQIPHVADLLANASNKAQGGVGDMSQALKQAGLVAAGMGLSIEETTAGLTAFASAGLLGSDAGTSFKTMLQRLNAPTGEAKALMDELNISAYDSQGNFVGLANVAEQLKTSMEKMTPAQRASAQAVIFGSDAVRAANVLYEQGADGINRWTKEVSEQGAAANQAATLTDNLKGDIERLGGAFDSVFINTAGGANGSLRFLTQNLTGLVNGVNDVPGPLLLAGGALTAFALLAPKGVLKYREYVAQLDSLGLSLDKISAKAPKTGRALEAVGRAGKGLALAAVAAGTLDEAFGKTGNGAGVQELTQKMLAGDDAVKTFSANIEHFAQSQSNWWNTDQVRDFGDVLGAAFDPSVGQSIDKTAGSLVGISTDVSNANAHMRELDQILGGLVSSGQADVASSMFDQFAVAAKASGVSAERFKAALPGYSEALAGVASAAASAVEPQSKMSAASAALQESADDAKGSLDDLRNAIEGLGSPAAKQRAAERDFQAAIDAATASIKENGKTLDDHNTKGRANEETLDALAEATKQKVAADFAAVNQSKGTTAATEAATTAMKNGRQAFIDAAVAAGQTKTQAENLATQLGLVPKDVKILVSQSGAADANAAIEAAARDRVATITVATRIADLKAKQASDAGAYPVRKASGGAIYGAGTATSDSIHALLSNGEHVWTAAEVKALGGQGAMYALRAAVRAGHAPRFANGGAVAASPTLAPSLLVSRTSDGIGRMAMTGQLDLGNGLSGFVRAIANDVLDERARNTNLRRVGG